MHGNDRGAPRRIRPRARSADRLDVTHAGRRAIVRKNDRHPEYYLWIDCDGKTFFLGVLETGMTRGDVKRMARKWIEARQPLKGPVKRRA